MEHFRCALPFLPSPPTPPIKWGRDESAVTGGQHSAEKSLFTKVTLKNSIF